MTSGLKWGFMLGGSYMAKEVAVLSRKPVSRLLPEL
jgi:hypothetical protein